MPATLHERILLDNSVERVINTTLKILRYIERFHPELLNEDLDQSIQDWKHIKWTTVETWNTARNQAFIRLQKEKESIS